MSDILTEAKLALQGNRVLASLLLRLCCTNLPTSNLKDLGSQLNLPR